MLYNVISQFIFYDDGRERNISHHVLHDINFLNSCKIMFTTMYPVFEPSHFYCIYYLILFNTLSYNFIFLYTVLSFCSHS